jgi:integrase
VQEHSTGLGERPAAASYKTNLEKKIQQELLHGRDGRAAGLTFAEIGAAYINREADLGPGDIWRIGELNEIMGNDSLADIKEGWARFRRARCAGLAPATVDRFRAILQAALNHSAEDMGYDAPRIKPIAFSNERLRWLTIPQADRLVASYAPHVRPIIRLFRYQGARTQEALQLQWSNIDMIRETIYFERTKNSVPRTVKMHALVGSDIWKIWIDRKRPDSGHVFLNRLGKPYADTRDYKYPGGNPLRQAHATACEKAAIRPNGGEDFTVHDWRHHWASWCVMEGVDLITIAKMGGWKDLRMVQRYAAVSTEHMDQAVAKLR